MRKKKIIGIILAAVLVAAGLGGFAYATNNLHEPMTGQKLVGWGTLGTDDQNAFFKSLFFFTNPDCVSEITIDRVSIFDLDGTVLYEGPLIAEFTGVGQGTPYTEPMKPHEQRFIVLYQYLCDPGIDIRSIPCAPYTVEIFWSKSHWRGLPLIGWSWEEVEKLDDAGNMIQSLSASVTEMVNMKQRVGP